MTCKWHFENILCHCNKDNIKQGYFCGSFYQLAYGKPTCASFFYQNKFLIGF